MSIGIRSGVGISTPRELINLPFGKLLSSQACGSRSVYSLSSPLLSFTVVIITIFVIIIIINAYRDLLCAKHSPKHPKFNLLTIYEMSPIIVPILQIRTLKHH
jgi:hypothetical protein